MAIKFVECSHVNFKNCAVFSILIKTPDANRLRACENHLIIEIDIIFSMNHIISE